MYTGGVGMFYMITTDHELLMTFCPHNGYMLGFAQRNSAPS